jgi:uroporphyrinogen-III decarboxylase
METILLIAVIGTLNMACFFLGAKVGNTVANGKEIETPTIKSPLETYREHQDKKKAKEEQNKLEVIMQNIERYDGTANHQTDVPT